MKSKCIDLQTLGAYFHGVLTHSEKERLLDHLVDCSECLETFNTARHVMRNPELDQWRKASENGTTAAMKEIGFRSSIQGKIWGFFQKITGMMKMSNRFPALSPVRSGKTDTNVLLDSIFRKSKIRITVESVCGGKVCVRVACTNTVSKIDEVVLVREEGGIISLPFEETEVLFENLSIGKYSVTMTENDVERDKYFFEIDETGAHERKHDHT